ncbi:MAG TPA: hypothetical protein VF109_07205 [Mycobacteriales bacterium]
MTGPGRTAADTATRAPVLRLLREAKVADLLAGAAEGAGRFEASGVLAYGGWLWVIFDNVPHVARIDPALVGGDPRAVLVRRPGEATGYEDIAHDPVDGRFFLLIEAVRHPSGGYLAQVQENDAELRPVATRWLDFPLDRPNKGLEGLSCVRRDGRTHLLALCEGNRCRGGEAGRRPGGGRVHVFAEAPGRWERVHTIRLPESLSFVDYSSISVSGDRIAVVSQESSALWVGRFAPSGWDLLDDGTTYAFPPDPRGRIVYGTVEGVSWLADDQVAVVSDRAKPDQPARFRAEDESVHVFALPAPAGGGW